MDGITFAHARLHLMGNEQRYQIALKGKYVFIISEGLGASVEHTFPRLISNVYKKYFEMKGVTNFPSGNFDAIGSYWYRRRFFKYDEDTKTCHVWFVDFHPSGDTFEDPKKGSGGTGEYNMAADSTNYIKDGYLNGVTYKAPAEATHTTYSVPCRAAEVLIDFINETYNYHRKHCRRVTYYDGSVGEVRKL